MMAHTTECIAIKEFCSKIGKNSLLVQGAGGNVSWKEGDVLWVKASGTWLSEAELKEIFVPVSLTHLQEAIAQQDFSVTPKVLNCSKLRPSIETLLHALMPQKIVIHLHLVQALSILVRRSWDCEIESIMGTGSVMVPYCKPGASLAREVAHCLKKNPNSSIIFLQSHGVVIGADSIGEAENILNSLTKICASVPSDDAVGHFLDSAEIKILNGYEYVNNPMVQRLALDEYFFENLKNCWALYPDHVVFLGGSPCVYVSRQDFLSQINSCEKLPELIFISGDGVYIHPDLSPAKREQLNCYAEVMMRQNSLSELRVLSEAEIDELINWDAEKYRLQSTASANK